MWRVRAGMYIYVLCILSTAYDVSMFFLGKGTL